VNSKLHATSKEFDIAQIQLQNLRGELYTVNYQAQDTRKQFDTAQGHVQHLKGQACCHNYRVQTCAEIAQVLVEDLDSQGLALHEQLQVHTEENQG